MGKGIKTKAAQQAKTLETVGEPGRRMKQRFLRTRQQSARQAPPPEEAAPPPGKETAAGETPGKGSAIPSSARRRGRRVLSPGQRMKAAFLKAKEAAVREQPICQENAGEAPSPVGETVNQVSEKTERALEYSVQKTGQLTKRVTPSGPSGTVRTRRESSPFSRGRDPGPRSREGAAPSFQGTSRRRNPAPSKVRRLKTPSSTLPASRQTAVAGIKARQGAVVQGKAAAPALQRQARMVRARAGAASHSAKRAAKVSSRAAKAAIAGARSLGAALLAGGGVMLLAVVVLCLMGFLLGSCLGIFFSGEDSGTGETIHTAIVEINLAYQERLEELQEEGAFDTLEISGTQAPWKEVLAVYAVKTTTDPHGRDVASMDGEHLALLSQVFWEMNQLAAAAETRTDGEGETEQRVLVVTVSRKTAQEMAAQLGFDDSQKEQLEELLSPEFDQLWSQLLYGVGLGGGSGDLAAVALSQVGNGGGQPYWSWYGFPSRVEWCACFVSWCAEQCGLIDSGAVPRFAGVGTGVGWFQARGRWLPGSSVPEPGMLIFFKWYGSDASVADHVGIVEKVENGLVYTIEGNSGDMVRRCSYPVGYGEILGYGAVEDAPSGEEKNLT